MDLTESCHEKSDVKEEMVIKSVQNNNQNKESNLVK